MAGGGTRGIYSPAGSFHQTMDENGRGKMLDATFGAVCKSTACSGARRRTLEEIVNLAVELAREGREGRKIGTLFVIGDVDEVLEQSRPLILDPLYGHPGEALSVNLPEFRETVKEFAQLDGAFVLEDDGTFVSAGRFVDVDVNAPENFLPGLGTRHAAGASITRTTGAIAVVVSQSSVVRVFARGELRAEIIPELFLMSRERLYTRSAEVSQMPEAGLTLAVAAGG
jgi:DNA integrity scanning protein DisA with diadenylate cyclase activity